MEAKAKWDLDIAFIIGITLFFIGVVYLSVCIRLFLSPADAEAVAVRSVFLPLGLVFFLVGSVLLTRAAFKKHRADLLVAEGRYIWATVTELQQIRSVNGLQGHPCVIQTCYTDPQGKIHYFPSRYLYRKPDASVLGKSVKVYLQNGDYRHYYVDVEPLLPRQRIN